MQGQYAVTLEELYMHVYLTICTTSYSRSLFSVGGGPRDISRLFGFGARSSPASAFRRTSGARTNSMARTVSIRSPTSWLFSRIFIRPCRVAQAHDLLIFCSCGFAVLPSCCVIPANLGACGDHDTTTAAPQPRLLRDPRAIVPWPMGV